MSETCHRIKEITEGSPELFSPYYAAIFFLAAWTEAENICLQKWDIFLARWQTNILTQRLFIHTFIFQRNVSLKLPPIFWKILWKIFRPKLFFRFFSLSLSNWFSSFCLSCVCALKENLEKRKENFWGQKRKGLHWSKGQIEWIKVNIGGKRKGEYNCFVLPTEQIGSMLIREFRHYFLYLSF